METFVEQFLAGKTELDTLDDFVDAWHSDNTPLSLSSFLGMNNDEYQQWIIDPAGFADYMNRRRETYSPLPA